MVTNKPLGQLLTKLIHDKCELKHWHFIPHVIIVRPPNNTKQMYWEA